MSAKTGSALAAEWIYSTLSGDATLAGLVGTNIYPEQITQGGGYPALIYAFYQGTDNVAQGASYWMSDCQFILRAADRVGSIAGLDTIMARVHVLLHAQFSVVLPGGYMLASERIRPIAEPDLPVAGVATRTLAWLYRIQTQEVPA